MQYINHIIKLIEESQCEQLQKYLKKKFIRSNLEGYFIIYIAICIISQIPTSPLYKYIAICLETLDESESETSRAIKYIKLSEEILYMTYWDLAILKNEPFNQVAEKDDYMTKTYGLASIKKPFGETVPSKETCEILLIPYKHAIKTA
jgi:hypothetical protein